MANQTITQLPIASSASTNDVFYIVNNYESGSPTLTGDSAQVYFSAISQSLSAVTLNNNINNAVVTATGTSPALNGESNLTFDGTNLNVTGSTTSTGKATFGTLQVGTGSTITATTTGTLITTRKGGTAQSILSGVTTTLTTFSNHVFRINWGQWDQSSGIFTANRNGVYRVTGNIIFASSTGSTGSLYTLSIDKNGVDIAKGINYAYTTETASRPLKTHTIVRLVSGDTLSFKVFQNAVSTLGFITNVAYMQFTIEEIGGITTN